MKAMIAHLKVNEKIVFFRHVKKFMSAKLKLGYILSNDETLKSILILETKIRNLTHCGERKI